MTAILEFFSHEAAELDPRPLHIVRVLGQQVGRVLERRAVLEHQALLLAELDHRAKNVSTTNKGPPAWPGCKGLSLAYPPESFLWTRADAELIDRRRTGQPRIDVR